ncbi:MAG TPA: hypothetical protein VGD00_04160 [Solirubrobacteraceae bacterium]
MGDEQTPLRYLNPVERTTLGWLVSRLCATGNARYRRALEETGTEATVRMACVNALRLYAIVLFVLGSIVKLAHVGTAATALYGLAAACMLWSFWCLYTVVGPEREFKQGASFEQHPT